MTEKQNNPENNLENNPENNPENKLENNPENKIERLLIVCTGNTCRSPMAAALARKYLPWLEVVSAGTATVTGLPASIGAMDAMDSLGLSIDDHRSQPISKYLLEEADLVLTMTSSHKQAILAYLPEVASKVFTLGEYSGSDLEIPDPFGLPVAEYEKCSILLMEIFKKLATKLNPQQENS